MKHVLLLGAAGLLLAGCTDEDYRAYNTYETPAAMPVAYDNTVVAPARVSTTAYSYDYKPYPYTSTWKGRPYVQSAYDRPMYTNNGMYNDARGEWINGRYVTYSAEPIAYTAPVAPVTRDRYWDSYQQRWVYTY